jgi:Toprim-like
MRPTPTSPTSAWDLVEAYSNPVPAHLASALADLDIRIIRTVAGTTGEEYLIRCPAHAQRTGKPDRHPSCWVNSESGAFICFSCGYSGPFVQLAADALGCDRAQAARWVLRAGSSRSREHRPPPPPQAPPALTEAALALFVPPPQHALKSRRLLATSCAAYGVLWDPRTSRWILPIREDPGGQLTGWQEKGRHVFRNRPTGVKKSASLFGSACLTGGTAVLVESPLDAVLLHSLGITGAVASYGALVSDAQMRILRRRCDRLILALDNDAAGNAARNALYTRWRPRGIPMLYLNYTHAVGKDPGELTDAQIRRAVETAHLPFRKR